MTEVEDLSPECFVTSPIWAWSDDKERHFPILDRNYISNDDDMLFIKADLITKDGTKFDGYIVGNYSFHAFFIFLNGNEFPVSLTSNEARNIGLKNLWASLGFEIEQFFPVTYQTGLFYATGEEIAGELTPKK